MGWTFSDDPASGTVASHEVFFDSLEGALEYCESLGMGYEVSYPKQKYHTHKDYASNFNWKGHPKAEEDIA